MVDAIRLLVGTAPRKTVSVKDLAQKASKIRQSQEPKAALDAAKTAKGHGEDASYFTAKQAGHLVRTLDFKTVRTKKGYVFEVKQEQLRTLSERYPAADSRAAIV